MSHLIAAFSKGLSLNYVTDLQGLELIVGNTVTKYLMEIFIVFSVIGGDTFKLLDDVISH